MTKFSSFFIEAAILHQTGTHICTLVMNKTLELHSPKLKCNFFDSPLICHIITPNCTYYSEGIGMEELKEEKRKGHIKSKTIKRVLSCPIELALQRWVLCICGPPVCTEHSNLSRCDGNDLQTLGSCDP